MTQQSHFWAYTPRKPELKEYAQFLKILIFSENQGASNRDLSYPHFSLETYALVFLSYKGNAGKLRFSQDSTFQYFTLFEMTQTLNEFLPFNFIQFQVTKIWRGYFAAAAKTLQSCPTLCDPIDCSPPGSPVPGILQARILEWVAFPFSSGSSQPRDQTEVSHIAGRFFTS